mgnify:CR=1 FL=1
MKKLSPKDKKWLKVFCFVVLLWGLSTVFMLVQGYAAEAKKLPTPIWPIALWAFMCLAFMVTAFLTIINIDPFKPTRPKN